MNRSVLIRHGSVWLEALLWPLAVVFLDAELALVAALSPLPTALVEPSWAARLLLRFESAIFLQGLPWALLGALAAQRVWKMDPRPLVLAGVMAIRLVAGPETPVSLVTIAVLLGGALLYYVRTSNREAEIWFYRRAPLSVVLISVTAGVTVWSFYFPLREAVGAHLEAAAACLIALCGVAAVPWIVGTPHRKAKLLVGRSRPCIRHSERRETGRQLADRAVPADAWRGPVSAPRDSNRDRYIARRRIVVPSRNGALHPKHRRTRP